MSLTVVKGFQSEIFVPITPAPVWTPVTKELKDMVVALVTAAGVHDKKDPRFNLAGDFTFRLDSDLFNVLKEIIQTQAISFVVPISRTDPNGGVKIEEHILFLTLKEPTLIMEFANGLKLNAQDRVFTSIHLHAPSNFQIRQ